MNRRKGGRRCWSAVGVALALVAGSALTQQPQGQAVGSEQARFIFVIDTSASMVGKGTGKVRRVIFPEVQRVLKCFPLRMPPEAEAWVVPFDQGPKPVARFTFPDALPEYVRYVTTLQATGQQTWIWRTLMEVLHATQGPSPKRTLMYLFTDGEDNDRRGPYRRDDVVRAIQKTFSEFDWFYYVALGVDVSEQDRREIEAIGRGSVLTSPRGVVPAAVFVEPAVIDLGEIQGDAERTVTVRASTQVEAAKPWAATLEADPDCAALLEPAPSREWEVEASVDHGPLAASGAALEVAPTRIREGASQLRVSLSRAEALVPGAYSTQVAFHTVAGMVLAPPPLRIQWVVPAPTAMATPSPTPTAVPRPSPTPTVVPVYSLVPLDEVPAQLPLRPGESFAGRFQLRVEPDWPEFRDKAAQGALSGLPPGLGGTLDDQVKPLPLKPGDSFTLRLENKGMREGERAEPELLLVPPAGGVAGVGVKLPIVLGAAAPSWWDWFWSWWWLWLLLLLLLLWLLWRWWLARRPWGEAGYVGPPPECKEKKVVCRGAEVNLGQHIPELSGLVIRRAGNPVLKRKPPDVVCKQFRQPVEEGESFDWDQGLTLETSDGRPLGAITITKNKKG